MTNFDLNSLLFHSAETLAFRILSIWKRGHSLGRVIAEKYVRGECFSGQADRLAKYVSLAGRVCKKRGEGVLVGQAGWQAAPA